MRLILTTLALLALACLTPGAAQMKTIKFPAEKCSIGLPKSWERHPEREQDLPENQGKVLLSGQRINGADTSFVVLVMVRLPHDEPVNTDEFARGVVGELATGAVRDTSRRWTLAGIDAVSIAGTLPNGMRVRTAAAFANDRSYSLFFGSNRRDPLGDADLDAILASFAFIGKPQVAQLVTAADSASLRTFRFESARCTIAVPMTWNRLSDIEGTEGEASTVLAATRMTASDTIKLLLVLREMPQIVPVRTPGVMEGFTSQAQNSYSIDTIGYSTLGGIDAIDAIGTPPDGSSTRTIFTLANGRTYMIMVMANRRELIDGADVRAILASFAFIGKPKLPAPPGAGK